MAAGSIDWELLEHDVMAKLKPFQRRTVEWAFECLYPSDGRPTSGRFLVADEVGLGKTMVARGVLVKALRHLDGRVGRADIVYICSNADIARQNIARLRIPQLDASGFQSQGRLTLMPLIPCDTAGRPVRSSALPEHGITFQAMTPGTSLDFRNDPGHALERAQLCLMLRDAVPGVRATPLRNLFAQQVGHDRFDELMDRVQRRYVIDEKLEAAFLRKVLDPVGGLAERLVDVAERFPRKRIFRARDADQQAAAGLIADLRRALASVCIGALEPDLVIFDEFQRFPKLLNGDDESARLARMLFESNLDGQATRVLLLSATPYRMCSLAEDASDTQHFEEFLATVRFLVKGDAARLGRLQIALAAFNDALRTLDPACPQEAKHLRGAVQHELRGIISRTDRVPATAQRDSMVSVPAKVAIPDARDLLSYVSLQRVAAALHQPDLIEYWRSAPAPLSFLSGYKLREQLREALEREDPAVLAAVQHPGLFLASDGAIGNEAAHARSRALSTELVGAGMHRLLWLPPALPCYALGKAFASLGEGARTKRLLFSSWRMVPRAVSTCLDRAFSEAIRDEVPAHDAVRHEATAGDYILGYPCSVLASVVDPTGLAVEAAAAGAAPTFEVVAARAQPCVDALMQEVRAEFGRDDGGTPDADWYWLGPALADLQAMRGATGDQTVTVDMFTPFDMSIADRRLDAESTWPRKEHEERVARWLAVREGRSRLGRMPADLVSTLARVAIAGPAVCALRAFARAAADTMHPATRQAASAIGAAVLHYAAHEQTVLLLAGMYDLPTFWRRLLAYCGDGCFQAVINEYLSVLRDDQPADKEGDEALIAQVVHMEGVLKLKPAVLRPEVLRRSANGRFTLESTARTLRHARPLLEDRGDGEEQDGPTPLTQLRNAFNSPFLPFVLSSTSIGQEGLDFHWYCHAIIHWNLPANPVDFEQRDGRVHRYRNHAVRRNLAHDWGGASLMAVHGLGAWDWMFERATELVRARGTDVGGMRPAWIYQRGDAKPAVAAPAWMVGAQGAPASIERHVPTIPLSRDVERLARMNEAVGCYRMVFAQPRQDDLLAHLQRCHAPAALAQIAAEIAIDLRPPSREPAVDIPAESSVRPAHRSSTEEDPMEANTTIIHCVACSQKLRVPTGLGLLEVTCPTCTAAWRWEYAAAASEGDAAAAFASPGAHLVTPRSGYAHHGVYVGDNRVVHYSGLANGLNSGPVEEATLDAFAAGRDFYVKTHPRPKYIGHDVVLRARSRIGEDLYSLFSNNCEHFCEWAINDDHTSRQIDIGTSAVAPAKATAAGLAALGTVAASGSVAGLSGAGIMSGLAAAGSVVGGGAVAGLAILGAAPAAAGASLINGTVLADNAALPKDERDSRAVGRVASYTGAAAGTAGSIGAVSALGVAGLSGPGITSGLAAIGSVVGGGMGAGVAIATALPVAAAAATGYGIYKLVRWYKKS
jgi:hypothetical protein